MKRTRTASLAASSLCLVAACSSSNKATTGAGAGGGASSSASSSVSGSTASSTSAASGSSTSSGSGGAGGGAALEAAVKANNWVKLAKGPTAPSGSKQDDISFLDANTGWAASGPNETVYATTDGGETWTTSYMHAGTYFRSVLFTDAMHGFAGNIGAGLSPSISDATLLYATTNGGATWAPVTAVTGTAAQGVCNMLAIDATHLVAVGRANGPAAILTSSDAGATWTATDLSATFSMIIDAHFTSVTDGLAAGMDPTANFCTIAKTTDGGMTFTPVFTSKTPGSLCWKLHFPSATVGYATVQATMPGQPTFAKTTDGGMTWSELPLPGKATETYSAIGVGFISEDIGWMAPEDATLSVYRTFDGGMTWEVDPALKAPINRFRFVDAHTSYAIGGAVWKLVLP